MTTATKTLEKKKTTSARSEKEKVSGAEAVILSLIEEGVEVMFGYPGGAIMPVYDALYHYEDKIKHILVRHEQGASHAAEGYGRMTGRPGVCLVTSGPGATNLVTGIADAQIDSTPMVCIIGQVKDTLLGTDAFQEADVMGITMPITKWNYQITKADEVPSIIAKAFYIARSGRPGPVVLDITKNAQFDKMSKEFLYKKCESLVSYHPRLVPKKEQVQRAADLINSAKKPYILAGHGVEISGAQAELKAFAEKTGAPVANTLLGLSSMQTDHPLYVGMLGMHGNYGPNLLTNEADVIIAVGMRFDDRVTGEVSKYARQAKVVHLEIDPTEIDKIIKADAPVVGDAKESLKALLPLVQKKEHQAWLNEFKKCEEQEYEKIKKQEMFPSQKEIKMAEVINMLSEKTKGEAIVVPDVGQHQMISARYYRFSKKKSFVSSGGLGTMGFALPASLGVKIACPDREVVAVVGDGCFQMTVQELGTIAQSKLPVKIILLNNNFLGMVRQWQQLFFDNRYSSVELQNPDFITIAKGFGIEGIKISERKDLDKAMSTLLASNKPFLLEVVVEKEENVFPMVPTGAAVSEIRLE